MNKWTNKQTCKQGDKNGANKEMWIERLDFICDKKSLLFLQRCFPSSSLSLAFCI